MKIAIIIISILFFFLLYGLIQMSTEFDKNYVCREVPDYCVDVRFGEDKCDYNSFEEARKYNPSDRVYRGYPKRVCDPKN